LRVDDLTVQRHGQHFAIRHGYRLQHAPQLVAELAGAALELLHRPFGHLLRICGFFLLPAGEAVAQQLVENAGQLVGRRRNRLGSAEITVAAPQVLRGTKMRSLPGELVAAGAALGEPVVLGTAANAGHVLVLVEVDGENGGGCGAAEDCGSMVGAGGKQDAGPN
jgi:hypothetical protein